MGDRPRSVPSKDYARQYRDLWPALEPELHRVFLEEEPVLGRSVERFEEEFAAYCGRRHGIGLNSGTDALVLALRILGIGQGDEVITQANTFIATVSAIVTVGARPVLVDPDPSTMVMDPAALEQVIGPKTRAVIPVHLYGLLCDMGAIGKTCARHGLAIVEDAAQAHGARRDGMRAGGFGVLGCFSFHPSKNLGAFGDGGMIVTDDDALADGLREWRNLGKRGKHQVVHVAPNSKLDTLQAALLRLKLPLLDRQNRRRRELAALYRRELSDLSELVLPAGTEGEEHAVHLYVVQCDRREHLKQVFRNAAIKFSIHYPVPPHMQPLDVDLGYRAGDFPVAEHLADSVMSLPVAPELENEEILRVCEVIHDGFRG